MPAPLPGYLGPEVRAGLLSPVLHFTDCNGYAIWSARAGLAMTESDGDNGSLLVPLTTSLLIRARTCQWPKAKGGRNEM